MFGMFFLLALHLQFVAGMSALESGLRVIPHPVALIALSAQAPKLMARFGVRKVMRTGFWLTAIGFALLATCTVDTPYLVIALALICTGSGTVFVMPGASQHIVGSLPLAKAGVGSAVNDVTREVGGALGIAVSGSIVATVYRDKGIGDSIGETVGAAAQQLQAQTIDRLEFQSIVAAAGEAFNDGTSIAFGLMAVVAITCGFFVARVIPDQLPSRHD
jgi:hypothetical protein